MDDAARRAGREPDDLRLLVVTKGHPVEVVRALMEMGLQTFGENYVEEAIQKEAALGQPGAVKWHMIGHVQSRKARLVVEHFEWLHSLDSTKLARRLSRFAVEQGRRLPALLECNLSGEGSKYGFALAEERDWPEFLPEVNTIVNMPGMDVRGLMCMAPIVAQADAARPYFAKARRLLEYLHGNFPQATWDQLSMGMSADFEAAILEGATIVRIGSAILGPRPPR